MFSKQQNNIRSLSVWLTYNVIANDIIFFFPFYCGQRHVTEYDVMILSENIW